MPDKAFKFTCHLGYEYEILIKDIQLLNYPIMIENIYINYLDKRIPCFITGIRYSMYLLHNGCGTSKINLFSSFSNLCIDLNRHFESMFGSNYFDPNFIRGIEKEKEI